MHKQRKMKVLKSKIPINENTIQLQIVDYLNNKSGLPVRVFRIKNMGTYDARLGFYRKFNGEKGIPDLMGVKKVVIDGKIVGRLVAIEVKRLQGGKRLSPLRPEQVDVLKSLHDFGAIVGVAYDIYDAMEIIADDPYSFPRKDRTFGNRKLREYIAKGTAHEKKPTIEKDPLRFLYVMEHERNKDKS